MLTRHPINDLPPRRRTTERVGQRAMPELASLTAASLRTEGGAPGVRVSSHAQTSLERLSVLLEHQRERSAERAAPTSVSSQTSISPISLIAAAAFVLKRQASH